MLLPGPFGPAHFCPFGHWKPSEIDWLMRDFARRHRVCVR